MNYQKIYDQLMIKAKLENRIKNNKIYYEKHHILPKCLGGSNNKSNLVLLTAREHYLAHRILFFIYPENNKLFSAFSMMCHVKSPNQERVNVSSKMYEYLKLEKSKRMSGENNPKYWLGKKRTHKVIISNETRQKALATLKNRKVSKETKEKISNSNMGKKPWNKGKKLGPLSDEHKEKISNSNKNKKKHKMTEEQKEKIRAFQLKNSSSARKIVQKNLNNEIINIFKSLKEAKNITRVSRISDALNGSKEIVSGFKWEYYYE